MRKNGKTSGFGLTIFLMLAFISSIAAQETVRVGDTVQTPDGRTGVIESIKGGDLVKVKFGENDSQYFGVQKIKKVTAPKPARTGPQETFRVGDIVVNKSNQQVRINSINGDTAIVQYGVGKYNVNTVKLEDLVSLKTWELRRDQEIEQKAVRAGFADDARPFAQTVYELAPAFDSKYRMDTGFQPVPATYAKMLKDLENLAVVCQKYPNLTNPMPESYEADNPNIRRNPADWCKMAEQRAEVVRKIKVIVFGQSAKVEVDRWVRKMNETMRDPNGIVTDDLQMLLYDRAAFEKKNFEPVRQKYIEAGEKGIPSEFLTPFNEKVAEFKAKIETDAEARTWKQPEFKDAALEGMVKAAYPKQFPGIKIFNTGMTWATWKAYDDKTYVGSDSNYRYYKLEANKNRYKRGQVLVKMPNQPYCQLRDFSIIQTRNGAAFGASKIDSLDVTGIFMKCP